MTKIISIRGESLQYLLDKLSELEIDPKYFDSVSFDIEEKCWDGFFILAKFSEKIMKTLDS